MSLIKASIILSIVSSILLADSDCTSCSIIKEQNKQNNKIKDYLLNDDYLNELYSLDTAESNWNLGMHFMNKDIKTSQIFFKKAAEKGHLHAYHKLAILNIDDKEKMIMYFLKSVESGFKDDLLNLFIATNEVSYLHQALDENIPNSYSFAAKYFFDTKNGLRYAEDAYNHRESFIEYFYYTNNIDVLKEGIKNNDVDSISLYSDKLIEDKKYQELLELSTNIENDVRIFFNRAIAFSKLNEFRNAKIELNKSIESLNNADPIYNKYVDLNLMKDKIGSLESYVCSQANVCRDF